MKTSNEVGIASTSRSTTLIPYSSGYYDLVEFCYLRGRYVSTGNNAVTVNGIWNP